MSNTQEAYSIQLGLIFKTKIISTQEDLDIILKIIYPVISAGHKIILNFKDIKHVGIGVMASVYSFCYTMREKLNLAVWTYCDNCIDIVLTNISIGGYLHVQGSKFMKNEDTVKANAHMLANFSGVYI